MLLPLSIGYMKLSQSCMLFSKDRTRLVIYIVQWLFNPRWRGALERIVLVLKRQGQTNTGRDGKSQDKDFNKHVKIVLRNTHF